MPFPEPIFPVVIIVIVIAYISSLVTACFRKMNHDESGIPAKEMILTVSTEEPYDPFADPLIEDPRPVSIVVETKFIEIGSGTEELGFDWIVTPTPLEEGPISTEN